MSDEQSKKKPPGLVYTFYSYKGGVGRSMALANVGVVMALERHRVLLVDWDLEAPGLEAYFRGSARLVGDPATKPGIVDLLDAHAEGKSLAWRDCLLKAEFFGHSLDIISAGRRSDDYRRRVQQLDWDTLYREHRIGNFVNKLRDEWRDAYDFVLIDSRTGITDTGDVCTVILPDVLVLLFVTNRQNIEGIKSVMARAVRARAKLPVNRSKLLGVPVPARDERDREYQKSIEWQGIFAKEFSELYRDWLPKEVEPSDALNKLFIPYVASWSFGESIPVIESERERADPTSIGAAYTRLATLLSKRLDWRAIDERASSDEIVGTRVELSKVRAEAREAAADLASLRVRTWWVLLGVPVLLLLGYVVESFYTTKQLGLPLESMWTLQRFRMGYAPLPAFVSVNPGSFKMGEQDTKFRNEQAETDRKYWGTPIKPVTIEKSFSFGATEVTFEQFDYYVWARPRSDGDTIKVPSAPHSGRGSRPVVNVSWPEAMAYAAWLGKHTRRNCRLPTEAEWEYAARAGSNKAYAWGDEVGENKASCKGCGGPWGQGAESAPVGSFAPNQWGLYDTSGNVWEWTCSLWNDEFDDSEQKCANTQDTARRVLRGGSWSNFAVGARSAARSFNLPGGRYDFIGFRVLCVSPID